jgi:hypothetical protein
VAAEVGAALGKDQPRAVRPAVEGQQDGGVGVAADLNRLRLFGRQQQIGQLAQMITWVVPDLFGPIPVGALEQEP